MRKLSNGRRILLLIVILVVAGVHVGLFAAGGQWRTLGKILVVVDLFSAWFVFGAVRETRKLEQSESASVRSRTFRMNHRTTHNF